jgi:Ca-activated chloride channel family protein
MLVMLLLALLQSAALAKVDWNPVGEGRLEIRSADLQSPAKDVPSVCPLRHTDVAIVVRGFVAEVTVTQEFHNSLPRAIEAEYIFPLPEDAAVNSTEMRIGERVIRGKIDRRKEARQAYETARNEGRRASLLEQERPNIFTQSVANIGPGETVQVVIRYVHTLPYADGKYELVFPMVVGPRYIPGQPVSATAAAAAAGPTGEESAPVPVAVAAPPPSGHGRLPDTDVVRDASRISPPVLRPEERCGYDINVTVDLDAGVPIRDVRSRAHQVDIVRDGDNRAKITLKGHDRIPNKDFVLSYETAGEQPEIGVLASHDGKGGYFTLVLQPPKTPQPGQIRPREILIVMDTSGSMNGRPLEVSKQTASEVLKGLRQGDRFNILTFNDAASAWRDRPVEATPETIRQGLDHIRSLASGGGTEMTKAIDAAFAVPVPEEYLRIVAFFTDGYIGHEAEVLEHLKRQLGPARLFSFGIGSSVNRYLIDRMAVVGRGVPQVVLLGDSPEEAAEAFSRQIARPVLSDVAVKFTAGGATDLIPGYVPDVFDGRPVYVYGRYSKPGRTTLEIEGRIGAQLHKASIEVTLPAPDAKSHSPLPSVWARQKIKRLEIDQLVSREPKKQEEEITKLALEYSLMSAYTSFVAVDETPGNSKGQPQLVQVAVPIPEGVNYDTAVQQPALMPSYSGSSVTTNSGGGGWHFGIGPMEPVTATGLALLAVAEWWRRRRGKR